MTCREEILAAVQSVRRRSGRDTLALQEILTEMKSKGTAYSESTIRTHVASRMCSNAPDHHSMVYDDLVRVDRAKYKLAR